MATIGLFFLTSGLYYWCFDYHYKRQGNLHHSCFGYDRHNQLKSKYRLAMAECSDRPCSIRRSSKSPTRRCRGADANNWGAAKPERQGSAWIVVVILVLLCAGGAAWFFLRPSSISVRTVAAREATKTGPARTAHAGVPQQQLKAAGDRLPGDYGCCPRGSIRGVPHRQRLTTV